MVILLAALYVHFGRLAWIQGAFYGIGAAVIAIIVRSAYKLVRSTLAKDWLLWILFAALASCEGNDLMTVFDLDKLERQLVAVFQPAKNVGFWGIAFLNRVGNDWQFRLNNKSLERPDFVFVLLAL